MPLSYGTKSMENGGTNGLSLVTGGTGLLGSHVAEQLHRRGQPIRALCRPGSDTTFLRTLNAEIFPGDITDANACDRACQGVDTVYHAAARVGDWGPWSDYVRNTIEATHNLINAASKNGVRRFLHLSSSSVYGYVNGEGRIIDETVPTWSSHVPRWGFYTRAKIQAERQINRAHEAGQIVATIVRPSWMYGPRDRATLPRLIDSLLRGKLKLIGDGKNRLNVVHAGNVAEAAIMAAHSDRAIGETYNCCHDGVLTQRDYFDLIADSLKAPRVTKAVPFSVAYKAAFAMECFGHLFRTKKPPLATRYAIWLMGRRSFFECQKLKDHVGWTSSVGYAEGIPAAVRDYQVRTGHG